MSTSHPAECAPRRHAQRRRRASPPVSSNLPRMDARLEVGVTALIHQQFNAAIQRLTFHAAILVQGIRDGDPRWQQKHAQMLAELQASLDMSWALHRDWPGMHAALDHVESTPPAA